MVHKILIVLIAVLLLGFQQLTAQLNNRAEVVSSGGVISTGGTYTNFDAVGEPLVNQIANGDYLKKLGFVFKLGPDLCPIAIYPNGYEFSSALHTYNTIAVTVTGGDCYWTATSSAPWIQILPGSEEGYGDGTIYYNVLANNTGVIRQGTITIAGVPDQVFTIKQYNTLDIPTLPEWGLISMGILLVLGGGFYLRRMGIF